MIEFKNVYKKYDSGTEALKNINLRIERGEFVFIVGASGSGKSTFLKTIMREEVPTSGTIMINNYDLTRMTDKEIPYFRRTMGIVFQDFRLIPNMTVYDNVAFAMRVIGANEKEIKKRVPYVLSLVGLQNKSRSMPNEISGGEQQRVALARALVNNANTIIADEPTGNIDPEMSYEIVDLLNHINENGTTVIMVTHEHELVKKFNHRIVVIDHGSVISDTAAGGTLTYDETTGYKPVEQPSEQPVISDKAAAVEALFEDETLNPGNLAPAISEAAEIEIAVAETTPAVEIEPTIEADPSLEIEEDPIQSEIAAKIAAVRAVPASSHNVEQAQDTPAAPVAAPDQSMYLEQLAAIESATKAAASQPTTFADLASSDNDFANIDGVDYSKYFEDTKGV